MPISGVVKLSGRLSYGPLATSLDVSGNASLLADILAQLPCSAHKDEEYTLTVDGDTVVPFGSLTSASLVIITVQPNVGIPPSAAVPLGQQASLAPITAKLTSPAGAAQAIPVDRFMCIFAESVPFTALSIARPAGIIITARVQLFQLSS